MMTSIAISFCWVTLGSMLFFGAVVAPAVFTALDEKPAGQFLRLLFPRIYLFCGLFSGLSTGLFAIEKQWPAALVLGLTCILFFYARGPLTNAINESRDAQLSGDEAAGRRFDRLHKQSTRIFGMQFIAMLSVAIWLGDFSS